MADTFQGTVESLLRVEDHDQQTILDFKLRSGPTAQRVKSRLEVADWLREGDVVEADGKKDNEGVLLADRLRKISQPVPAQPGLSGRFLIGLCFLMLVSFVFAEHSSFDTVGEQRTTRVPNLSWVAFWMVLGAILVGIPRKWTLSRKVRLRLQAMGGSMIVAALASLVDPGGPLIDFCIDVLWMLIAAAFAYAVWRRFIRKTSQ